MKIQLGQSIRQIIIGAAIFSASFAGASLFWRSLEPVNTEQRSPKILAESSPDWNSDIALCQFTGNCATQDCLSGSCDSPERVLNGVKCCPPGCAKEPAWSHNAPIPWQAYGQGEYVGPARAAHTPEYRVRVDDTIQFVYRLTLEELSNPYELEVGDSLKLESLTNAELNREVSIQPDGNITVIMLGAVRASRRSVVELQNDLEKRYKEAGVRMPALTVTPLRMNTKLENLRAAVDSRFFSGGQGLQQKVMPDGFVRLPWVDGVPAQGLTLDELKLEVNERYREKVDGLEVTPLLFNRAPRFVYVAGEVKNPGRYVLEGPTTALMALALGGGSNLGGNLREIVVFRRTDDWKLMATRLDMNGAVLGKRPCPADEIWLRDSDIVLVPKSPLLRADGFIELAFTRGLYGVVPAQHFFAAKTIFNQSNASTGS